MRLPPGKQITASGQLEGEVTVAKLRIVVTDDRHNGSYDEEKAVFEEIDAEFVIADCTTPQQVVEACQDADGVLCNLAPMNKQVLQNLKQCKVISRYGVGYDNVDVGACTEKGILLTNVTDYCCEEVSDHALALMLACARKVARRDAQVRAGQWNIGRSDPVYRIAGKIFSFLGFGMIARCLLRKIRGFDFAEILVYDPFVDKETIKSFGAQKMEWDEALTQGDFISVHMPLNKKTRGIINADAFAKMKRTAILVNTSRGAVIDEPALINALTTGQINSAGLDVHLKEPLDKDSPLMKIENCVLTDHLGWYSEESISELKTKAARNVKDVLMGKEPKYMVNNI